MQNRNILIFGGSGFIGSHFFKYFENMTKFNLYNFDIHQENKFFIKGVKYLESDVRSSIKTSINTSPIDIILNLAAKHTTPGHRHEEYFETNVLGAKNVCDFAVQNGIKTILFTSSISTYGTREEKKDENSNLMPTDAYGMSKIQAEHTHVNWQKEDPQNRNLIIIRPSVVFGLGENGNYVRLYKMISKNIFFYPGRKNTIKASVYVKDLVSTSFNIINKTKPGIHLYNICNNQSPTIEDICTEMANVIGKKKPRLIMPIKIMQIISYFIYYFGKMCNLKFNGIHPDRIKKLVISTNISSEKLFKHKNKFHFTLREALVDWYSECNEEGLY